MTNYKTAGTTKANSRAISTTVGKTNKAFELFNKVFKKYSADEVFVSFNGGKDCTVVLDLLSKYLKKHHELKDLVIPVLYIRPKSPFPQVENFVAQCEKTYPIDLIKQEGSIKTILANICAERPNLKAVVMGVRSTDPQGCSLKPMQLTDPGWPPLLRVNPILDWSCQDVWSYLRDNNVAYCSLYDMGYTSLGDSTNTVPNEHLRRIDPVTGEVTYRPAYELADDTLERDGRN